MVMLNCHDDDDDDDDDGDCCCKDKDDDKGVDGDDKGVDDDDKGVDEGVGDDDHNEEAKSFRSGMKQGAYEGPFFTTTNDISLKHKSPLTLNLLWHQLLTHPPTHPSINSSLINPHTYPPMNTSFTHPSINSSLIHQTSLIHSSINSSLIHSSINSSLIHSSTDTPFNSSITQSPIRLSIHPPTHPFIHPHGSTICTQWSLFLHFNFL